MSTVGPIQLDILSAAEVVEEAGATSLPAFSKSTIARAVESAGDRFNKDWSTGGRALTKKLGQNAPAFRGIAPTTENAQGIVDNILSHPVKTVFGDYTYDAYNSLGQGARFDIGTNRFVGFLDRGRATR